MAKPIYKEINANNLSSLSSRNVLIDLEPINFEGLTDDQKSINVFDEVFMLKATDVDQMQALPPLNLSNIILPVNMSIGPKQIKPETLQTIEFSNSTDIVQNPENNSYLDTLEPEVPEEEQTTIVNPNILVGVGPRATLNTTPTRITTAMAGIMNRTNNSGGGGY